MERYGCTPTQRRTPLGQSTGFTYIPLICVHVKAYTSSHSLLLQGFFGLVDAKLPNHAATRVSSDIVINGI